MPQSITKDTVHRKLNVLKYVKENPDSSAKEISIKLSETIDRVNDDLDYLVRNRMISKTKTNNRNLYRSCLEDWSKT